MRIADWRAGTDNFDNPILKSAISDRLAEATGVEPARALRDGLANRCHTVRRRLLSRMSDCRMRIADWQTRQIISANPPSEIRNQQSFIPQSAIVWRKARESNPTRSKPPQFSGLFDSLYCRAFLKFWQGCFDFGLRIADCGLRTLGQADPKQVILPIRIPHSEIRNRLVHVVGLAPTKSLGGRPIYSRVPLLLSHTCKQKICYAKKQMKAERNVPRRYFEAHFS